MLRAGSHKQGLGRGKTPHVEAALMTEIASHPRETSRDGRSREWWVADEEPESVSAEQSERHGLPWWLRHRAAMLVGLAAAALFSAILL